MPTEHAHLLHNGADETLDIVGGGGRGADLSTVGLMLRETRERYDLTLRDVANALRIRVVYLHALEEGRFVDLPGRTYVTGFLRSYSEYFGLDGEEVVRRYREERADSGRPSALVFPEPPPETRYPVAAILAILAVVSVVGYGAWQLVIGDSGSSRPIVAAVPTGLAGQTDEAESSGAISGLADGQTSFGGTMMASAEPTDAGGTSMTRSIAGAGVDDGRAPEAGLDAGPLDKGLASEDPGEQPVEDGRAVIEFSSAGAASLAGSDYGDALGADDLVSSGADVAATPGAPAISPSLLGFPNAGDTVIPSDLAMNDPAFGAIRATGQGSAALGAIEASASQIYGEVNTDARVILRASEDCWIQINDGNGSEVFTRLLKAGEIYKVPDRDDLRLRMGNAGGLEVIVDGTPLPMLGQSGEVMRNVSLDPAALLAAL